MLSSYPHHYPLLGSLFLFNPHHLHLCATNMERHWQFILLYFLSLIYSTAYFRGIVTLWLVVIAPTHEGMAVDLGGWLRTKINVPHQELNPDMVTHPSPNRARCRLSLMIETSVLPLHQTTTCGTVLSNKIVLKVICKGFSQNWWKVDASGLLQYKCICVTDFDKLHHEMLKIWSLMVILVSVATVSYTHLTLPTKRIV